MPRSSIIAIAIFFVAFLQSCSEPIQPVTHTELIPLGDQSWTYTTSTGGETESMSMYQPRSGLSYVWDSVGHRWQRTTITNAYILNGQTFGLWSSYPIFSRYDNGTEKGLLCGYDNLDSGAHYWFRLPDHPSESLSFTAHSLMDIEHGDTAGGVFQASLNPTLFSLSVPAGTFSCYRLITRFDGNIGIGAREYLHTVDTMYLAPGKGIVKRILEEHRTSVYDSGDSSVTGDRTVYELSSMVLR